MIKYCFLKPHDPQFENYAIQLIVYSEEVSNLLHLPEVHHKDVPPGGGVTSRKKWRGYAARFPKPLPYS